MSKTTHKFSVTEVIFLPKLSVDSVSMYMWPRSDLKAIKGPLRRI